MNNRSSCRSTELPSRPSVEPRMMLADFRRDKCAWFCQCSGYQGIVAAAHRPAETMCNSVTQR